MKAVDQKMTLEEAKKLSNDLVEQQEKEKASRFEKILDTEMFPMELVSEYWLTKAIEARRKSTPSSHGVRLKDLAKVVNICGCSSIPEKLSLFQFGILYNSLESVSQDQLELSDEQYEDLLQSSSPGLEYYQPLVKLIREKNEKDVDEEFRMKRAAIFGTGGKSNGLKTVIGQA